jgi:mannose-1-phosphate guanylyltransferase
MWPESRETLPKQFILIGQRSTFQTIVSVVSDPASSIRPGHHHQYRFGTVNCGEIEAGRGADPART